MGVFRRGRLAVVGAVAGIALMVGTVPAAAQAAGSGAFDGTGTITPGLGVTGTAVTFSLTGTLTGAAVVNGNPVVINDTCTFSGGGANDSVAEGMGTVTGSCAGSLAITLSSGNYVRVGTDVTVTGSGSAGGVSGTVAAKCVFRTTQAPPVTSFNVDCEASAAG